MLESRNRPCTCKWNFLYLVSLSPLLLFPHEHIPIRLLCSPFHWKGAYYGLTFELSNQMAIFPPSSLLIYWLHWPGSSSLSCTLSSSGFRTHILPFCLPPHLLLLLQMPFCWFLLIPSTLQGGLPQVRSLIFLLTPEGLIKWSLVVSWLELPPIPCEFLLWVELCSPKRCVEVLTPGIPECNLTWK